MVVCGKKRARVFLPLASSITRIHPHLVILVPERPYPCYGIVGWLATVTPTVDEDKTRALEKLPNEGNVIATSRL
ncbi:uncharacterized protein ARMOST_22043 [Armillaria ostoyae]|uniref:Uncharacterized protein n=1 Tax=Armillaria ostoyae TaxID=47428 RepID=A0A284SBT2_ARMOS|nr:uncharacterized protein ARMOST_22043 [Armillaria ostoyae]